MSDQAPQTPRKHTTETVRRAWIKYAMRRYATNVVKTAKSKKVKPVQPTQDQTIIQ